MSACSKPCGLALAMAMLMGAPGPALAGDPFPVEPFPFPFRSVAGAGDIHAVRFNPASLAQRQEVEFGWHHKFSEEPSGFNALTLRAKSVGLSVSWLDDAVHGSRREYLISAGKGAMRGVAVGATFRWLKADQPLLQNRTLWTFSTSLTPTPAWSAGVRWENALNSKVNGAATDGVWIFGVRTSPLAQVTELSVDWIYPEWAAPADTHLRFALFVNPAPGLSVRGFMGTDERAGLELVFSVERSQAGVEARMRDFTEYKDGTLYVTVLDHEYPQGRKGPGERAR